MYVCGGHGYVLCTVLAAVVCTHGAWALQVGMRDPVQKAHFALVLLEGKAHTWFTVQGYSFDKLGDTLE